jgi:uncharacterized membrane protein/nitrite reductase/ring-hydroxylating ferredoxin subunit
VKSKANIKGHPIHPILVSFPIAFLIGAFLLDLLFLYFDKREFATCAIFATVGGLFSGLAAAAPGLIDFIYSVPPKSSASKRAGLHGILNTIVLALFATALILRLKTEGDLIWVITCEGIGVIVLTISGWLGGTLVTRNQIGIDHRYANAGKWKDETIITSDNKVELKHLDELKVNAARLLRVNGKRIVVARTEQGIVAFDDRCTHRGASLADGVIICNTVQCPWHGSQFDLSTGDVKAGPAKEKISLYTIQEVNGTKFLQL